MEIPTDREPGAHAVPTHDPDVARKLYEQIGALYARLQLGDEGLGDEGGVEEFADFLATVREALRTCASGSRAIALAAALYRYERDRSGA